MALLTIWSMFTIKENKELTCRHLRGFIKTRNLKFSYIDKVLT